MKKRNLHFRVQYLKQRMSLSVVLVVLVGTIRLALPASSAPVTSTATSKLTVYQGVITVAPGVAGDNLFEVGNAGRDLAGSGDIFVRPGGVSGASTNFAQFNLAAGRTYLRVPGTVTAGYLTVSPSDTVNEGGEIALARSSGLYQDWFLDVFQSSFRIHSAGIARLIMNPSSTTIQSADIDNGFHGTILRDASGERIRTGYSNVALDNAAHSTQVAGQLFWGPGSGAGDLFGSLGIASRGNVASGITLFTSPGTGLQPRLRVANNGDVHIISGSLCFGNAPGNCSNTWAGLGGGTLDTVLAAGNTSNRSASLGTTTAPTAKLVVHNTQFGPVAAPNSGSAGDGIAVYANSANSALYGRQNGASSTSYGGYFSATNVTGSAAAVLSSSGRPFVTGVDNGNSQGVGFIAGHQYGDGTGRSWAKAGMIIGDLEVNQTTIAPAWPTWGLIGDLVKVQSNTPATGITNDVGFAMAAYNADINGFAARFKGGVLVEGAPSCTGFCIYAKAALQVQNTYTSGANISSTAIMATSGTGGIGFDAYAGPGSGSTAIRATGNGVSNYAARFVGPTLFEGSVKKQQGSGNPQLEVVTWVQIPPGSPQSCYSACGGFAISQPLKETGQCLAAWIYDTWGGNSAGNYIDDSTCGRTASSLGGTQVLRCLCR